jgi:hypothetical protein
MLPLCAESSVTRLAEFSLLGRLFTSDCFSKITKVAKFFVTIFSGNNNVQGYFNKEWVVSHFG